MVRKPYVGAEVLKSEALNGVDAELGVGLNNSEATGHYPTRLLLAGCSSLTSDQICDMFQGARIGHTEVLLVGTALLEDLNETGLELLDGGNVVGEDTHLTGGGGDVDLGTMIAEVGQYLRAKGSSTRVSAAGHQTYTPVDL